MGLRYGGKLVNDYSAMRGPCPDGFHVPMESERQTIKTAVETWWSGSGSGQVMALASYLKIPLGGCLARTTGALSGQGSWGTYWMCTSPTSDKGRSFDIQSSSISFSNAEKGLGQSIRPFKDTPVIPDNSWTVEYQGTGTAGIYSNATLGLISISSDGTNWTTISDKNLGATQQYSILDSLSEANCGKYYQRGNNYGFPYTGAVTTSSTAVDTTGYGPGNYYSNSTFIKKANRSSPTNYNLWGGVTGVQQRPAPIKKRYYGGKLVNDYSAMRGPCPDGFHVPYQSECATLKQYLSTLGLTVGNDIKTYLHFPSTGSVNRNGTIEGKSYARFRCADDNGGTYGKYFGLAASAVYTSSSNPKVFGYAIRPFKDTPVAPTSGWTKTYTGTGNAGIYRNSTLGLISISSDGTNWITIADKNLGATQVWSSGDTVSGTNGGNFFQRGNNYGFPLSSQTINNTQVDASTYGPGNYYSSSTFITAGYSISDWSNPSNSNLRGGVTGVQQRPAEVIKVYKGNTLIREKS